MRPEIEALKDHPHFGALFGQLAVTDVVEFSTVPALADQPVPDVDVPAGRAFEVVDAAQQRRLARATGADDGDRFAGIDFQVDAFEHLVGAEALVQVDHSQERFHAAAFASREVEKSRSRGGGCRTSRVVYVHAVMRPSSRPLDPSTLRLLDS